MGWTLGRVQVSGTGEGDAVPTSHLWIWMRCKFGMDSSTQHLDVPEVGARWFLTTDWSSVRAAQGKDDGLASAALSHLCQTYWYPIYAHIRRSSRTAEDAKDLTQEFFARFLEKDYLRSIGPEKGRFRSCLLVAVNGFLANERDRANRHKRGGGREFIPLDAENAEQRYSAELMDERTPDRAFAQRWAMTLLDQVIRRLETELAAEGKAELFEDLKIYLTGAPPEGSQKEIAAKLHISESTLRVIIHRLRQRYRQLLRLEIAQTVSGPEEIEDELRHLFAGLSG